MSLSSEEDDAREPSPTTNDNSDAPTRSVVAATAELWTAQEPKEIAVGLRGLHEALLAQEEPEQQGSSTSWFDPSDVFLAVQGASLRGLRVHNSTNNDDDEDAEGEAAEVSSSSASNVNENNSNNNNQQQQQQQQHYDYQDQWLVLQESMWTIAALTRVCVGPAWWYQASQRRRFRKRNNTGSRRSNNTVSDEDDSSSYSKEDDDNNDNDGTQSSSDEEKFYTPNGTPPTGRSPQVISPSDGISQNKSLWVESGTDNSNTTRTGNTTTKYPPIPDILPAALLRFTANAIDKSHQLVAAIAATTATDETMMALGNTGSNSTGTSIPMEQRMNLVEAQLFVVQKLCCANHNHHSYENSGYCEHHHHHHHHHSRTVLEWNIPGAHETVGMVLAYGLKLVCTGRLEQEQSEEDRLTFVVVEEQDNDKKSSGNTMEAQVQAPGSNLVNIINNTWATINIPAPVVSKDQWEYILLVTRAVTDLIASGWRPLPLGPTGHDVVLSLLVIASRGIKLDDLHASAEDISTEACEERLIASSCAAEAFSALLSLTTRGLVPQELHSTLVRTTCRLHAVLAANMGIESSLLYPMFAHNSDNVDTLPAPSRLCVGEEGDEIDQQIECFASQRESCLADASDILWAMMETESSVEETMTVLFSIIETATRAIGDKDSVNSPLFNTLKWNDQTDDYSLQDCASVIRVMSGALWGVAPDFHELSILLRIFWLSAIQAICQLLSTVQSKVAESTERGMTPRGGLSFVRSSYFTRQVRPLVVDAITGLEAVVDAELNGGHAILSAVDWGAFVDGIESAVIPWLSEGQGYRSVAISVGEKAIKASTKHITMNAESLLIRVGVLLEHWVSTTSPPLIEYACLRRLLLLLLKNSAALGEMNARTLDLSVFRAWILFGLFPFRLDGWADTASEILTEAFSTEKSYCRYACSVQLEALELLTFDVTNVGAGNGEYSFSKSYSLLVMTRNMQDLYQDIVGCIMPILKMVLVDGLHSKKRSDRECDRGQNCHPRLNTDANANQESSESIDDHSGPSFDTTVSDMNDDISGHEDFTELQLYAVKLAGRLFRDLAGNRKHRAECLVMLQRVSLFGPPSSASGVSVRAEALGQLGMCLCGIFCEQPFAHESLPVLVDALSSILDAALESIALEDHVIENGALAAGVLSYLGRLQLNTNGALTLLPVSAVALKGIPFESIPVEEITHSRISSPRVATRTAALVVVRDEPLTSRQTNERTVFSFRRATTSLQMTISKSKDRKPRHDGGASRAMLSSLRRLSCEVLCHLLRSGVLVEVAGHEHDLLPLNKFEYEEVISMFKYLSGILQLAFAAKSPPKIEINLFAEMCELSDQILVIKSCRFLFALVSSMEEDPWGHNADSYGSVLHRLEVEANKVNWTDMDTRLVAFLLSILNEALLNWRILKGHHSATKTFELCCRIISATVLLPSTTSSLVLHVALQCALTCARYFTPVEATIALEKFGLKYKKRCVQGLEGEPTEGELALRIIQEALELQIHPRHTPVVDGDQRGSEVLVKSLSSHQKLANQCYCLEKFVAAETGSVDGQPCAAWLYDKCAILTCRVGSLESRYRGYVEVVIRSSSIFRRCLIPIPGKLTLPDPDFPLLLPFEPKLGFCGKRDDTPLAGDGAYIMLKTDSSKVLDKATSVLDRFDAMFPSGAEPVASMLAEDEDEVHQNHPIVDGEGLEGGHWLTEANPAPRTSEAPSEAPSNKPSAAKSSTVHADSTTALSKEFIWDWLASVFGWHEDGREIMETRLEKYLQSHGFFMSSCGKYLSLETFKFRESERLWYDEKLDRAICILDRTTPSNVYKFGLVYLGSRHGYSENATLESRLLSATRCSPAFHTFSSQLGEMVSPRYLKHYSAGLDTSEYESDGSYSLAWSAADGSSTVVFHDAHLMPPGLTKRKRHIGNDNVLIVFVDESAGNDQEMLARGDSPLVSGQFNFATIVVRRLPRRNVLLVSCLIRANLPQALDDFAGEDILAEDLVGDYVRGLAMKIDLACRTMMDSLAPPTNSLDRARQISEMRRYVLACAK